MRSGAVTAVEYLSACRRAVSRTMNRVTIRHELSPGAIAAMPMADFVAIPQRRDSSTRLGVGK